MPHRMDGPMGTGRRLRRLWAASAPLTATGLLMLVVLAGALAGLLLDPRTITGVPAWLKPAKFAVSIAIYTLTLAWIFTLLDEWRRTRWIVGVVTAVTLVLEIIIIVLQAWRGTTSHFNVGTPLDLALWATMGSAIVVQTLASVAVAFALWRRRFSDPALGWALRLGIVMTIVGASIGGLMTRPTSAQIEDARLTTRMAVAGAHTVGAPDGGPGLPGTGWSLEHGDVRVAHFVGLHALQVMPLIFLGLSRSNLPGRARVRLIATAAASYSALFAILLWQALRGQALLQPDAVTLGVVAVWAAGTAAAAWAAVSRRDLSSANAVY
jgi:hypothetical protein